MTIRSDQMSQRREVEDVSAKCRFCFVSVVMLRDVVQFLRNCQIRVSEKLAYMPIEFRRNSPT